MQCINHLLEICLYAADNLVTIAIVMYLADVVQHRVGLVAVAWAQFKEQSIANNEVGEMQDLALDLGSQQCAVSSGHCEVEACRLEVVRTVLQGLVEDGGLHFLALESTKVVGTMIRHEVITPTGAIDHGPGHLR